MRKCFTVICILVLTLLTASTAYSADIDGFDNGAEWDGAAVLKLIDGESNCNVNFGLVKAEFDNDNSAVFFSFMFIDPLLEQGNDNAGISVSIEGSEPFVLTMSSTPNEYDIDKYSFSGAMSIDENSGATCEIRIGVKYGLTDKISGDVRFIDSNGSPSNFYDFSFNNDAYVHTTAKNIYENTYSEKVTSDSSKKTTIKASTTKETTKKTTGDKISDDDLNFDFIFDLFTEPQTKNKTDNNAISSTKHIDKTEKVKTEVSNKREESSVGVAIQTAEETTALFIEDTSVYQSQESVYEDKKSVPLSKGSKYKIITGVVCGLALIVIATLGTFKFKNEKAENDPKQ